MYRFSSSRHRCCVRGIAALLLLAAGSLAPAALLAQDCNRNGVPDSTDLASGTSRDCNSNGAPDECDLAGLPELDLAPRRGTGARPRSIAAADFNGDGKADLAVGEEGDGSASVLFGSGDGTFPDGSTYVTGAGTNAIVAGDLDRDGALDLATADSDAAYLTVLLGNGDGSFQPTGIHPTLVGGRRPGSLAVGDVNADGKLDLAAGSEGNIVSVFLGNGDGTFANGNVGSPFGTGGVLRLATVDLDGDGKLDLVTANAGGDGVSVLLGNGDGTFRAYRDFPAGDAYDLAAADLDADGKVDVATANFSTDNVSVLLGDGDGTLRAPQSFPAGDEPYGIYAADLDGDSKPDLATADSAADTVSILLGTGDGAFVLARKVALGSAAGTGPQAVVASDLNGDGRLDLAVPAYSTNDVWVVLNRGVEDCDGNDVPDACETLRWELGPVVPAGVHLGHGGAANFIGDFVYLSHGHSGNRDPSSLWRLDVLRNQWTADGPPAPSLRSEVAGGTAHGKHYVFGGIGDGISDKMERFDPKTDTWEELAPMNAKRAYLGAASWADKVYAVGGNGESGVLGTVEVFNPSQGPRGTWSLLPSLPSPVSDNAATVAFQGKIYVFGGHTSSTWDIVQIYDIATETWHIATPMPTPRGHAMAAVLGNKIVVFGGYEWPQGRYVSITEIYDPLRDTWSRGPDMREPTAFMAQGVVSDGKRAFSIGTIFTQSVQMLSALADCNLNGVPDPCDLAAGTSTDCDSNGLPDECDITEQVTRTTTVYSNDFENAVAPLPEWSTGSRDLAPGTAAHPQDRFLGQFGGTPTSVFAATLSLEGLPEHDKLVVSFDLYAINSLDGIEVFKVSSDDQVLLETTFNNHAGGFQHYPGSLAAASYPSRSGAVENDTLGPFVEGDAVYRLSFELSHASSWFRLTVSGQLDEPLANESWGLDNIEVRAIRRFPRDCNENRIPDSCDIAAGRSGDCNSNEVPDECELARPPEFDLAPRRGVGVRPRSIASGDFNGDGKQDLAAGEEGDGTVSVVFGAGDGTFPDGSTYVTGPGTNAVVAADLNGDGALDLATADSDSAYLTVLLGTGDGTFQSTGIHPTLVGGRRPGSLAVGDVNADGKLDLAAGSEGNIVSVFLGKGDGTFVNDNVGSPFGTGGVLRLATVDLDRDGKLDLVTANAGGDGVSVLLGNGDGTFRAYRDFPAGDAYDLAVDDLDADGKVDVATANFSTDNVSVLLGNGDGTLRAPQSFPAGDEPYGICAADLDGDLTPDLAIANSASDTVSILLGEGDGTLVLARNVKLGNAVGPGPQAVVASDLNGDGRLDLAVPAYSTNDVWVLINRTEPDCNQNGVPDACDIADGTSQDCDRDGLPDDCDREVRDTGVPRLVLLGEDTVRLECGSPYGDPGATADDDCAGDLTGSVQVLGTVDADIPGSYTVTYTVADPAGNEAEVERTVLVADTTPAALACPSEVRVGCQGPEGARVPFEVTALDRCDPVPLLSCVPAPGSLFPLGRTTVECTATDASGNLARCSFDVIVEDRTPPAIQCPGSIAIECSSSDGAAVEIAVTATDACDPAPRLICAPASGSRFPVGTTQVVCTATDASGNQSQCALEVVVTCGGGQVPGDCNQDGTVDLSDAICLLGFLFTGSPSRLPCANGRPEMNLHLLDWNDDGDIDLSDPVGALTWLFAGGRPHALGEDCLRLLDCPDVCAPAR